MTLKNNEIEDLQKRTADAVADGKIIDDIVIPVYVDRVKRYAGPFYKCYQAFIDAGFTADQAITLTRSVVDYFFAQSAGGAIPLKQSGRQEYIR